MTQEKINGHWLIIVNVDEQFDSNDFWFLFLTIVLKQFLLNIDEFIENLTCPGKIDPWNLKCESVTNQKMKMKTKSKNPTCQMRIQQWDKLWQQNRWSKVCKLKIWI